MNTFISGRARLRIGALALAAACGLAQAQTPAPPTPTTPPEGMRPPVPAVPPPPVFTPAPPLAAPVPPRPLAAPAPSPGMPRARPPARIDCRDKANQKLPICNQQKDPGIQRTPSTAVDPDIARPPPPTGDGVAKGVATPELPRTDRRDAAR